MTRNQWRVLIVAVALFSLSELFPPWLYEDGWTSAERPAGYHFILARPEVRPYGEMKELFSLRDDGFEHHFTVKKDYLRLFGQRLTLLFLMSGLLLLMDDRRAPRIVGGMSLCVGLGILSLCVLDSFRF